MRMLLRDACQFYSGTGFPEIYQGVEDGHYPFYKVGDISANVADGNVYLQRCGNYITEEVAATIRGTIIPSGTVVFAKIGEALKKNRRALTACNCLVDNNAMGIAPRNEVLRTKYFFYYMCNLKMQEYAEATAVPSVRKSRLEQICIDVPDLIEQEIIEKKLDTITGIIKERQRQLSSLDILIKARFVEMFGDPISNSKNWPIVELGKLTSVGSSKRIFEKEYVTEGIPFYRTKEIVELSKGINISTELYITKKRFAEIKKQYGVPETGDLLISAIGTIGVIWIVDGKNEFYYKDGNIIRVNVSDSFDSAYMKVLLEYLIAEYKKLMSAGTAYAALTISGLSKMKVYNVPIDLQKQFSSFVFQINKSKSVIQQALAKDQLLFNSLMQKYFG